VARLTNATVKLRDYGREYYGYVPIFEARADDLFIDFLNEFPPPAVSDGRNE